MTNENLAIAIVIHTRTGSAIRLRDAGIVVIRVVQCVRGRVIGKVAVSVHVHWHTTARSRVWVANIERVAICACIENPVAASFHVVGNPVPVTIAVWVVVVHIQNVCHTIVVVVEVEGIDDTIAVEIAKRGGGRWVTSVERVLRHL